MNNFCAGSDCLAQMKSENNFDIFENDKVPLHCEHLLYTLENINENYSKYFALSVQWFAPGVHFRPKFVGPI